MNYGTLKILAIVIIVRNLAVVEQAKIISTIRTTREEATRIVAEHRKQVRDIALTCSYLYLFQLEDEEL